MNTLQKIRRFISRPSKEIKLFFEALFLILYVKLLLKTKPIHKILLQVNLHSSKHKTHLSSPVSLEEVKGISSAVNEAAYHLPFDVLCLTKALVCSRMLVKRNICFQFKIGVRKNENLTSISLPNGLNAHAWVVSQNFIMCSNGEENDFKLMDFIDNNG